MDDPAEQRRRLAVHRARIVARTDRLTRLLHVVGRMTDGKDPIMTNTTADPSARRAWSWTRRPTASSAVDLYNSTWTLLERPTGRRPRPTR